MADNANCNRILIEVEDFISKVQSKGCLWDQKDPNYFKRDHQRVAWMEIADDMQAPVNELKKRWRGLRDTFCRELRKMSPAGKADEQLAAGAPWRHFRSLLFLRESICTKKPSKRPRTVPKDRADSHDTDNENEDCSDTDRSSSENEYKVPLASVLVKEPEPAGDGLQGLHNVMDSDVQFLMSLVPFLQDVPRSRKLLVRAKLAQVLMDEQGHHHR